MFKIITSSVSTVELLKEWSSRKSEGILNSEVFKLESTVDDDDGEFTITIHSGFTTIFVLEFLQESFQKQFIQDADSSISCMNFTMVLDAHIIVINQKRNDLLMDVINWIDDINESNGYTFKRRENRDDTNDLVFNDEDLAMKVAKHFKLGKFELHQSLASPINGKMVIFID